ARMRASPPEGQRPNLRADPGIRMRDPHLAIFPGGQGRGVMDRSWRTHGQARTGDQVGSGFRSWAQLTAFFTSAPIFASSVAVNWVSAKAVGHMAPLSRSAASLKPNVAYLVLNFCALWKKQTTLPSLAYAGIPYQVFGERAGALALMIAWSRLAMARSGVGISASF